MTAIRNPGYCHCCRSTTQFQINDAWLRDHYVCRTCGSIPRQRHLQLILDTYFAGWEKLRIHESSPSNDYLSRHCAHYSASQFLDGVAPGASLRGVRCEDLERLTFGDGAFDLFITQDVLEHVFNPDRAAAEIMRVLRPGGAHVYTAPKHKGLGRSAPRARLKDGKVEHLQEEVYHGSPVNDGRILVTWDYGNDFEFLMFAWSGGATTTYVTRDRQLGLDGEFIEVFVTRKH